MSITQNWKTEDSWSQDRERLQEENRALQAKLAAVEAERDKWNENHRVMCRVEHEQQQRITALEQQLIVAEARGRTP